MAQVYAQNRHLCKSMHKSVQSRSKNRPDPSEIQAYMYQIIFIFLWICTTFDHMKQLDLRSYCMRMHLFIYIGILLKVLIFSYQKITYRTKFSTRRKIQLLVQKDFVLAQYKKYLKLKEKRFEVCVFLTCLPCINFFYVYNQNQEIFKYISYVIHSLQKKELRKQLAKNSRLRMKRGSCICLCKQTNFRS